LINAVIENYIEAAGCCDDELLGCLERVSGSGFAAWDVVQIVDTLDLKRDLSSALDETQIATRVANPWQLDDLALLNAHRSILPL
jgi:hypothetical protein